MSNHSQFVQDSLTNPATNSPSLRIIQRYKNGVDGTATVVWNSRMYRYEIWIHATDEHGQNINWYADMHSIYPPNLFDVLNRANYQPDGPCSWGDGLYGLSMHIPSPSRGAKHLDGNPLDTMLSTI